MTPRQWLDREVAALLVAIPVGTASIRGSRANDACTCREYPKLPQVDHEILWDDKVVRNKTRLRGAVISQWRASGRQTQEGPHVKPLQAC